MKKLDDLVLSGKRVFLRADLNVPLDGGKVTDDTRIQAILPTLTKIIREGGKAVLASHLDRPKGRRDPELSLKPVALHLEKLLNCKIPLAPDCIGKNVETMVQGLSEGQILLLENLRFHPGEEEDDLEFAKALAALGDVYVNDAFAVSHRKHASVHAIVRYFKECAAGYQLWKELDYYHRALENPQRPVMVIVGGAKVSTKIGLLKNLLRKADKLLIGGAMATTFLKALGKEVGKSLVESEFLEIALELMKEAEKRGVEIILPVDAVVAPGPDTPEEAKEVDIDQIPPYGQMLDIGPKSVETFKKALRDAATIVWNGPLGAFETPPFDKATFAIARYLGECKALSVVGGGDSASAVKKAGVYERLSYVSTGGGAFLELLEGKSLPGVEALEECGSSKQEDHSSC